LKSDLNQMIKCAIKHKRLNDMPIWRENVWQSRLLGPQRQKTRTLVRLWKRQRV
jgi:hypothetical protein